MMKCIFSTEMSSRNTVESTESANCLHGNTKKAKKFGKKCAYCLTRVWKFWRTRKCLDCKAVFHKSCALRRENEEARKSAVEPTTVEEALPVRTVSSVQMTAVTRTIIIEKQAPLYLTPALSVLQNITMVTVDCRGREKPLVLILSRRFELSAAMLAGLFDVLPARSSVQLRMIAREAGDSGQTAPVTGRRALPCLEAVERV